MRVFMFLLALASALLSAVALIPARAGFDRAAFEAALYEGRAVDWGPGNAYFALAGLGAPEDVADTYAWGRARALRAAHIEADRMRAAGVDPALIPALLDYDWDADPGAFEGAFLEFDTEGMGDARCLYDPDIRKDGDLSAAGTPMQPCATPETLAAAIAKNQTLWARFQALPDHTKFSPVLSIEFASYKGRDLITMHKMQAAQIALLARAGRGEEAYARWARFTPLYRSMAAAPGTVVEKAVALIIWGPHMDALEPIILHAPEVVAANASEIHTLLTPSDAQSAFRADRMMADELAATNTLMMAMVQEEFGTYPARAQADMALCLEEVSALGRLPASAFPFGQIDDFECRAFRGTVLENNRNFWKLAFAPGGIAANTAAYLLYGGVLKGAAILKNMHIQDARMRMALLAAEVLAQGVADADIPAFAAGAPEGLRNPITGEAFGWDPAALELYFERPASGGHRVALRLPER